MHHWLGRIYVTACCVGGLAGGLIALFSSSGRVAGFGFLGLAMSWLYCTITALVAARRRDFLTHQRWMTRSFALTFAAVMLRIYLPLSLAAGFTFGTAYSVIAWACWVPNLVLAQFLLRRAQGAADF